MKDLSRISKLVKYSIAFPDGITSKWIRELRGCINNVRMFTIVGFIEEVPKCAYRFKIEEKLTDDVSTDQLVVTCRSITDSYWLQLSLESMKRNGYATLNLS